MTLETSKLLQLVETNNCSLQVPKSVELTNLMLLLQRLTNEFKLLCFLYAGALTWRLSRCGGNSKHYVVEAVSSFRAGMKMPLAFPETLTLVT